MNRRDERLFRRKLLIHPKFQLTLIALNWIVITLAFALLYIQAIRVFSDMSPLASLSGIGGEYATKYLGFQQSRLTAALVWAYVIAMLASGVFTLIVSYRFAGPLVRLRGYFERLSKPDAPVNELSFRTGDYFTELLPVVNATVKRLASLSRK